MRAAPAVSCARCTKKAHTSIQVQRRQSGIPCAMALRLMPCSPRRRIPFCHRRCRLDDGYDSGWIISATDSLTSATDARTTRFCRTQPPCFAQGLRRARAPFVLRAVARSRKPPCEQTCAPDAAASTASHPAFVTTRDRPSCRNGMARVLNLIWPDGNKYFSENQK